MTLSAWLKKKDGGQFRLTGISMQKEKEMGNQITVGNLPKDVTTGLTLPLSKSLASQDLDKHRAMVAVELEVMAKKMDRFGWDRDRGSAAHDRLVIDWMDALQDYPLDEVKTAFREWVLASPRKMPNEGDIVGLIQASRRKVVEARPQRSEPTQDDARERAVSYTHLTLPTILLV